MIQNCERWPYQKPSLAYYWNKIAECDNTCEVIQKDIERIQQEEEATRIKQLEEKKRVKIQLEKINRRNELIRKNVQEYLKQNKIWQQKQDFKIKSCWYNGNCVPTVV